MSVSKTYRVLALVLAFALAGVPELLAQTQSQPSAPQQPAQTQPNTTADPSLGPVEPAQSSPDASADTSTPNASQSSPSQPTSTSTPDRTQTAPPQTQPLPDAPSNAGQTAQPAADSSSTQATQPASNVRTQEPAGTAAAGKPESVGGAASKPAGTAMAPAKQRQVRSWLIKLGAIAAAGVALGVVYGLSKGTSPKPPGAATTTVP